MGRIIMGYWDCSYCNTIGVNGSEQECPNCGHPRDKDVEFYMKGNKNPVDKITEKKVRERGRDWRCFYCDGLNPGNIDTCGYCGATKTVSAEIADKENETLFKGDKKPKIKSGIEQEIKVEIKREIEQEIKSEIKPEIIKKPINKFNNIFDSFLTSIQNCWKIITISAISLILIALALFLFVPYDIQAEITDTSWSRSISIEEYKTFQESDWSIPTGGRLLYTQTEFHHYEKVLDHYETKSREVIDHYEEVVVGYEDLGNGFFEEITEQRPVYKTEYYDEPVYRNEPVYATKYYYEIDRWTYSRSVKTSGNDKEPYWGEVVLHNKEREGARSSNYYITIKDGKQYSVSESDWSVLNVGDNVTLSVNRVGFAKLKSFEEEIYEE